MIAKTERLEVGQAIRDEMLADGAVTNTDPHGQVTYKLQHGTSYAWLDYTTNAGYNLQVCWATGRIQSRTDAKEMRTFWDQWRKE